MQRLEIDGIPVLHRPGPRRTTMALVFGVGVRDETFSTRETTHLVEHLVMGTLPKSSLRSNGMTTVDSTHFHATGRPEAVASFIEGVCAGLRAMSLDRVHTEVGVLQAEDCSGVGGFPESMLAQRYGLAGPGLAWPGGAGPEYLRDEDVLAFARRWFVAGNAVLVCHGELPAGLRLDLPPGPRPEHAPAPRRPQPVACWAKSWAPGVGLMVSADGPWDPALRLAFDVLAERVQDVARTQRGLSYSTGVVTTETVRDQRDLVLGVDAREGQEGAVATILWEQWRSLCADGPRPDEVAHAVDALREELDGADEDDLAMTDLVDAALAELLDVEPRPCDAVLEAYAAVTPERVRDAARAVWSSALLQVPEWSEFAGLPGLDRWRTCGWSQELPAGRVLKPSALARVLPGPGGKRRVVLSDGGIAHLDEDGDVHAVGWDQLNTVFRQAPSVDGAGKQVDGGALVVVGGNACMFRVDADSFGTKAVEAAAAHVRQHAPHLRWLTPRPARWMGHTDQVPVLPRP
ncbi:M16 family metallopeptidase [Klenkia brasiliensis]|uniref:M16 family metallopeptidase n=1 Tax=Klenkia brasiliensis TaxID=333142 RepID=UPI000B83BF77|nr:insulinase family protein [Klenkia brasiliensis]